MSGFDIDEPISFKLYLVNASEGDQGSPRGSVSVVAFQCGILLVITLLKLSPKFSESHAPPRGQRILTVP